MTSNGGPRAAIIAGCRTPFAKAGTVYRDLAAVDLGKACVRELVERSGIDPASVGTVVMGQVIPSVKAPNLAREVVLGTGLPAEVPAHTVNRACASGTQAIAEVASEILAGHAEVGIAGGAESLSDVPVLHSKRMARALVEASRARSLQARLRAFAGVRPRDLAPEAPAIAEPSTGLTMGQSAEKMAKENGITREEQDAIAYESHKRAAAAMDDGRLPAEIAPVLVPPEYSVAVTTDNLLRRDTSLEALAALPPVFDRKYGTVTAGNSSPLTDGAAAVLLMSERRAAADGLEPLAFIRSWAVAAVDPGGQLLMGPGLAIPKALDRAGLTLADMDLIEMHEAFAAQVASNIQALESETWARDKLGRAEPVGKVDRGRLNVSGGSIALGHPFGATGARIATTLANELKRRGGRYGLLSVCAQGGMGFAMVLER
ncbi:MAG TPA: acetyl-CoA C-acyltransferase FadI [Vicinamibacteria bacterium]|nr:acetyl-CoA C-acyltransferase FadI [Vicinamibacteria bacterium]